MNNKKVASLLNKGIKFETLKMLNETQIDTLYGAIIKEQSAVDAARNVNTELDIAREKVAGLRQALVGEEDLEEDDVDNIKPFKGQQTQDPKQVGPSSNDGMDDYQDGMDEEVDEEFRSKSQQGYFFVKCEEEGPKSEWCKLAREFADDTKDFSKLPDKVEVKEGTKCWKGYEKKGMKTMFGKRVPNCVKKESKEEQIRQIEESIVSLVKKYVPKTMSKKDLMNLLEQGPGTKEAPVKTPTRTKPERKTPYKPKHKPAPKAGETETAPSRVKPGTIEKPERKTPYKPKHKPAPKAGKKELPSFLKFNTLNIQFRDEQED
jgi:hypothetical protein